jgi:hypothetical protein
MEMVNTQERRRKERTEHMVAAEAEYPAIRENPLEEEDDEEQKKKRGGACGGNSNSGQSTADYPPGTSPDDLGDVGMGSGGSLGGASAGSSVDDSVN